MANNRQRQDETRQRQDENVHQNGLARDLEEGARAAGEKAASTFGITSEEVQGYAFLTGGVLLFLHTIGYFALLNWVLMAGAVALILYGAKLTNLWEKSRNAFNYFRDKYNNQNNNYNNRKQR